MPINSKLLEILICPACQEPLCELDQEPGLECSGCGRIYPVRNGIPVMLVEEASEPTRSAKKD
jgi:uncharacterized protein YbaR (Trm112 family)